MSANTRKKSQTIIAVALGGIGLLALFIVSQTLNNSSSGISLGDTESGVTTTMIADRTSAAAPEMSWVMSAAGKVEGLEGDVKRLEDSLRNLMERHEAEKAEIAAESDALLERYEETITRLEAQLGAGQGGAVSPAASPTQSTGLNFPGSNLVSEFLSPTAARPPASGALGPLGNQGGAPSGGAGQAQPAQSFGSPSGGPTAFEPIPFSRQFTLTSSGAGGEAQEEPATLSNYLPAGSYAPAIVLSGVDASTSVTSQAEPIPVVFRITSPAVTAGTRSTRGHTIDLTGCTVTGSARGDLSSERVYVRLLKLSCVQAGGRVFERDVAGYMSGAGKAGARGLVVSREGRLVTNAAIAGALGGLADGISSVNEAANGADQASFEDVLRGAGTASAAGGVSGAANRLSEYYIERAEQYQPVVSLYGGTAVELVFMEGVDLD